MASESDDKWAYGVSAKPDPEPDPGPGASWPPSAAEPPGPYAPAPEPYGTVLEPQGTVLEPQGTNPGQNGAEPDLFGNGADSSGVAPDLTNTTRLSTGRFASPTLGAYNPDAPAAADSTGLIQDADQSGYFDNYEHGADAGDGEFEFEDGSDFEEEEAALSAMGAARRNTIEWAVVLVGAVLLALILRALLLQAFWIPSPSMESTLLVRDRVLVNKISYRLHDINRGDVVVFRRTDDEIAANPSLPQDVIKRVIALEGETILISDNKVFIDGGELLEPYLDEGIVTNDFGPETVPEGHIFVMGDNRGLSSDSRFETGPVAHDRVVGRAFFLFWPLGRMGAL